jgi:hypothetical protein
LAEVKGGAEKLDGVVWVLRTWRQQLMAGLIAAFTAGIEDRSGQLGCRRQGSGDFSLVFLFSSSSLAVPLLFCFFIFLLHLFLLFSFISSEQMRWRSSGLATTPAGAGD